MPTSSKRRKPRHVPPPPRARAPRPPARRRVPWWAAALVVVVGFALVGLAASAGGWWWLAVPVALAVVVLGMTRSAPYADDREVLSDRPTFGVMLLTSLSGLALIVGTAVADGPFVLWATGLGLLYVPYVRYGRMPRPTP